MGLISSKTLNQRKKSSDPKRDALTGSYFSQSKICLFQTCPEHLNGATELPSLTFPMQLPGLKSVSSSGCCCTPVAGANPLQAKATEGWQSPSGAWRSEALDALCPSFGGEFLKHPPTGAGPSAVQLQHLLPMCAPPPLVLPSATMNWLLTEEGETPEHM